MLSLRSPLIYVTKCESEGILAYTFANTSLSFAPLVVRRLFYYPVVLAHTMHYVMSSAYARDYLLR